MTDNPVECAPPVGFDRTLHQPPRIDKKGFIKDASFKNHGCQNALAKIEGVKMPEWWGG